MTDKDLFGEEVQPPDPYKKVVDGMQRNRDGSFVNNPLARLYGPGPEGTKRKTCKHLTAKHVGTVFYKCDLRIGTPHTASPKSDHRVNWPTCAKYEP